MIASNSRASIGIGMMAQCPRRAPVATGFPRRRATSRPTLEYSCARGVRPNHATSILYWDCDRMALSSAWAAGRRPCLATPPDDDLSATVVGEHRRHVGRRRGAGAPRPRRGRITEGRACPRGATARTCPTRRRARPTGCVRAPTAPRPQRERSEACRAPLEGGRQATGRYPLKCGRQQLGRPLQHRVGGPRNRQS